MCSMETKIQNLNSSFLIYTFRNSLAKLISGISQFVAGGIFLTIHSNEGISYLFFLLGLVNWFQIFEFGMPQTIQNLMNNNRIKSSECKDVLFIFLLALLLVAFINLSIPYNYFLSDLLLNSNAVEGTQWAVSILIIACFNNVLHRYLLLTKKPNTSTNLIFSSAILYISAVYFYGNSEYITLENTFILSTLNMIIVTVPFFLIGYVKQITLRKYLAPFTSLFVKTSYKFFKLTFIETLIIMIEYLCLLFFCSGLELITFYFITKLFLLPSIAFQSLSLITLLNEHENKEKGFRSVIKKVCKLRIVVILSIIVTALTVFAAYKMGALNLFENKASISTPLIIAFSIYSIFKSIITLYTLIQKNLSNHKLLMVFHVKFTILMLIFSPLLSFNFGIYGLLGSFILCSLILRPGRNLFKSIIKNEEKHKILKIIHLHPNKNYGDTFVMPLVKQDIINGYNSEMIAANSKKKGSDVKFSFAISTIGFSSVYKMAIGLFNLAKYLIQNKPNILVSHNSTTSVFPLLLGRLIGIKRVIYFNHGVPFLGYKGIIKYSLMLVEILDIKISHEVITVSNTMARHLQKLTYNTKLVSIVNNGSACGINVKEIEKKVRNDKTKIHDLYGIPYKATIAVYIGRPTKRKGAQLALELWRNKFFNNKDYYLVMVGVEYSEMKTFIEKPTSNIVFTGFTDKAQSILWQSDCYLMLSLHEGLSYAVLESMILKCPIISLNIQGMSDVLTKKNSILIEPTLTNNEILNKLYSSIVSLKNKKNITVKTEVAYRDVERFDRERFLKAYSVKINNKKIIPEINYE